MLGVPLEVCVAHLASARQKLFSARAARVRPARDEKVLTSWNALMIKGMARAARAFGRAEWLESARRAALFLHEKLWLDGRLLATYKDGRAQLNAYLDDHAFLIDALLELVQTEFRAGDLEWARALADLLLEQFEDREHGGFYFVSHDHEALIHRPKTGHDNATPAGNGVAAFALQRLGHLTGDARYLDAAERALRFFYGALERSPSGHTSLLCALDEALAPPRMIVLRGPSAALERWKASLDAVYRPDTLVVAVPQAVQDVPAPLGARAGEDASRASAWLCEGTVCRPPVFELAALEKLLGSRERD
jgi:hypothetical protein